jgi:hypothetical protein
VDFLRREHQPRGGWVIGTRSMIKALLIALLEPTQKLRELERRGISLFVGAAGGDQDAAGLGRCGMSIAADGRAYWGGVVGRSEKTTRNRCCRIDDVHWFVVEGSRDSVEQITQRVVAADVDTVVAGFR